MAVHVRAVLWGPDSALTSGLASSVSGSFPLSVKWACVTSKAFLLLGSRLVGSPGLEQA